MQFLQNNWVTIVTILVLALIVFLAIRSIVRDRKAGIGPCGHKCSECKSAGNCASLASRSDKSKTADNSKMSS